MFAIKSKISLSSLFFYHQTGGNQREQARAKNLKKKEKEQKGKSSLNGQTINQKKER